MSTLVLYTTTEGTRKKIDAEESFVFYIKYNETDCGQSIIYGCMGQTMNVRNATE